MPSRPVLRILAVSGAAALAVVVTAPPALAHVTVSAPGAEPGGYGVLTFRVPTESDTAATTGLKVQLPAAQPLSSVRVKPKAGWTATITRAELAAPISVHGRQVTEAASVVEWRAEAGTAGIRPEEFDEFQLSVGPLPQAPSMTFKAIQRYSDGTEVSWIDEPAPGSTEEPEHPAPTLALGRAEAPAAAYSSDLDVYVDGPSQGQVTGAYAVGGAGLLAGLTGLGLAVLGRRRRTAPQGGPAPASPASAAAPAAAAPAAAGPASGGPASGGPATGGPVAGGTAAP